MGALFNPKTKLRRVFVSSLFPKTNCFRTVLCSSVMLAVLTGFAPAKADVTTVPIIVKDTTSSYWQTVLAGARKAGKELGIKVPELGAQSEADVAGQIATLEKATSGKPAAIVIAPTQFAPLGKPIDEAAKSVKIVGIDSGADSKGFTSFLTTDNIQGGRVAADEMAAGIKAKTGKIEGEVALITAMIGAGSLDQRAAGFKAELAAKYPGLKLVAEKVADGKAVSAQDVVADLIKTNPNLDGVFGTGLLPGLGAGKANAEAGGKITVVSFDSDARLLKLLNAGSVYSLILQDPFRMGYEGVKTALAASKGESVPANVDTGVVAVTVENLASARSQDLLNPKLN